MATNVTTEDLIKEHEQLRPKIDEMCKTAQEIPSLSEDERSQRIGGCVSFLREEIIPAGPVEENSLYQQWADKIGAPPEATAIIIFDHQKLADYTSWLEEVDAGDINRQQELLYGTAALLESHFDKEEKLIVPIIEGGQ